MGEDRVGGPVNDEILSTLVRLVRTCYITLMRIISPANLKVFSDAHPETKASLTVWVARVRGSGWATAAEVQAAFPKAKVLNSERIRFEIAGGNYRLVVAFAFSGQIAFVKFIGTHSEYGRIDALTVSQF